MSGYGGNVGAQQRRGGSGKYQSLFYRDMNLEKGAFRSPSQSTSGAVFPGAQVSGSSMWRETVGAAADPPPPPCFTLEDRTPTESMLSPPAAGEFRSPDTPAVRFTDGRSPLKTPLSGASSIGRGGGGLFAEFQSPVAPPAASSSPSWWSTPAAEERENAAVHHNLSQHHEQQHQGGLLTLPAPRQIIRPEVQRTAGALVDSGEEGDEWVTVYGFQGEDTNGVLREFEKCGPIVRHVPGPSTSNWLHIQYQSRQDAQKALRKNGVQLYGSLIIGVKPLDPMQRQALMDKAQKPGIGFFMPAAKPGVKGPASAQASARPYYLQSSDSAARPTSTIASPTKSLLSKVVDLVLGF